MAAAVGVAALLLGCGRHEQRGRQQDDPRKTLEVVTTDAGRNARFEHEFLTRFAERNGVRLDMMPPNEAVHGVLSWYLKLLSRHSPKPDIYQIDVIFAESLADEMVDLTPYFPNEIKEIDTAVLKNFTIRGRLIAVPTFVDAGVLYYRTDLLKKYGYRDPPSTWEQLQVMAKQIQDGERRQGRTNFWGYVWQGGAYEGLTCNALEWQAAAVGPESLSKANSLHVNNAQTIAALKRATGWIGNISPPGEAYYRETDSANFWSEGDAAFMRNWLSTYSFIERQGWPEGADLRVAPLPGGAAGQHGTMGGLAMGVSRYSQNKELAIRALRSLTSADGERQRVMAAGTIPVRKDLRADAALMARTALPGKTADVVMAGVVSRSAIATGATYVDASNAYYKSINAVLLGVSKPEQAMNELEAKLAALRRTAAQQ